MFYTNTRSPVKTLGNYPLTGGTMTGHGEQTPHGDKAFPYPGLPGPQSDVESWAESIHHGSDCFAHVPEVIDGDSPLRIAKDYVESKVSLHLHLRIRPVRDEGRAHEFCAVIASDKGGVTHIADFTYVLDDDRVPGELARREALRCAVDDGDGDGLGDSASDVEYPVLVYVVKPGKESQVRLSRVISKVVGLDVLDNCPIIKAYSAQRRSRVRGIPLPAYIDGELRSPRWGSPAQEYELPDEIVKRGPQVVAELSDEDPETGIGEIAREAKAVLAGVAVELTDDAAVFLVKEGAPFAVERGQVLVRAFKTPIDGF